VRHHYGEEEILYSWWSYRARDWQASNRGRRLDHIWVSADTKDKITNIHIDTAIRGAEKPSDHVPLVIELASQ
jgi:exodeoxyribonuclease-3